MLQFKIDMAQGTAEAAATARAAMEGGCMWLQLHAPAGNDSEIKELAETLIPECRERGVILTLENRPELARELGVHGVCLLGRELSAGAVRESLGAEAIIGVEVASVAAASTMQSLDIDYVLLPADFGADARADFMADAAAAGLTIPVVADGDFTAADAASLRAEGVSGVLTGSSLARSANVADAVAGMIEALNA